ncbi:MAG: hypothetical protein ACRCZ0_05995 [Cetobacterium sp.]
MWKCKNCNHDKFRFIRNVEEDYDGANFGKGMNIISWDSVDKTETKDEVICEKCGVGCATGEIDNIAIWHDEDEFYTNSVECGFVFEGGLVETDWEKETNEYLEEKYKK